MRRGDLVYVDLGGPAGREQARRRPAITVLADNAPAGNPMTMVVPLTTNLATLRFPHTIAIEPSPANQLVSASVLLVFQLRALDRLKILQVRGRLDDEHLQRLETEPSAMLGL